MLFPDSMWRSPLQKVQLVSSILHLVNRKPLIKYDQRLFSWAFRCESLVSKSSISLCNLGHEFVSGFQPMTCVVSLSTILASCISLVRVRLEEIDQVWSPIRTTNPRSQVLLWPRVLSFMSDVRHSNLAGRKVARMSAKRGVGQWSTSAGEWFTVSVGDSSPNRS